MTYRRMVTIVSRRVPSRVDLVLTVLVLGGQIIGVVYFVSHGYRPNWVTVACAACGGYLLARVVDYLRLAAAVGRAALPRKDPSRARD